MKTALIIICILLLIPLLLALFISFKLRIIIGYNQTDGFFLRIRYLFMKYALFPRKKAVKSEIKANSKVKEPESVPENDEKQPEKKNKKGFADDIKALEAGDWFELLKTLQHDIVRKLYFEKLYVYITAADGDAAKTAVLYGRLNAAVFPVAGLIHNAKKARDMKINIDCDFTAQKLKADIYAEIITRPIHTAVFALKLYKFVKHKRKGQKNGQ